MNRFALVDANNFYASCERVFNPWLIGKPVVVLSNNDGCVIARSEEAKLLGIEMGAPAFKSEEIFRRHGMQVLSSNYALYGDMSARVMASLRPVATSMEIYSIDEAFLLERGRGNPFAGNGERRSGSGLEFRSPWGSPRPRHWRSSPTDSPRKHSHSKAYSI